MTPLPTALPDRPTALPARPAALDLYLRLAVTAALLAGYFLQGHELIAWLREASGVQTMGIWVVAALLVALVLIWRKVLAKDKRFHAPLLVTSILLMGDAGFGILESHPSAWLTRATGGMITTYSPTFLTIVITVAAELLLGRFYYGKWPHVASAYVSGISAGILIKSPALWPFVMCGLIAITSKYVLRIGDRHLWNPTNLGVTMMLFLAPEQVASLSVQAGNSIWAPVVIWCLGGMILYQLGRLHQPVAFVVAFVPLSFFRAWVTGDPWQAELAPITSPMFQLYIFFMITDPKTTVKGRWWQVLVVVLVAVAETFYRLAFRDVHSLYHALFTVGPIANMVEIAYLYYWKGAAAAKAPVEPGLTGWGPVAARQ